MSDQNTLLFNSLALLSTTKNYADISISELTKNAGVSRMYFYRHYQTFDDIITAHINDIFSRFLQLIGRQPTKSTSAITRSFFEAFAPDLEAFVIFLNNGQGALIQRTFEQDLTDLLQTELLPFPRQNDAYWQSYVSGGLSRVLVVWFEDAQRDSPKVMGERIAAIVDPQK